MRILCTDFEKRVASAASYVRYLVKKVKETGILIDTPKHEKRKTMRTPENLIVVAEIIFTVVLNIKPLIWRHTKFNWFRSWRQLTIKWVFASLSRSAIDLQKMAILAKKNHLFRWSSFWSWRVCKQAELSHLGHRKPPRIHWKADAHKTSHCLVWILVQKHNWPKWARRCLYSQWR